MPSIVALLHTNHDALRLGRALETLYPCDEIVVVDHGSADRSVHLAREYGASVVDAMPGVTPLQYLPMPAAGGQPPWILCLDPRESLTEKLAASLFEWKCESFPLAAAPAFSVFLREETAGGWVDVPAPQTRLVPTDWAMWEGNFPVHVPSARALDGELLRFVFP